MLEIFLLIFLSKKIGKMAGDKGHSVGTYKALTFVCWFLGELAGAILGLAIFGSDNYAFYIVGLAGAASGYGLIYFIANGLPDKTNQDSPVQESSIENI
jgi:hypothetical protein